MILSLFIIYSLSLHSFGWLLPFDPCIESPPCPCNQLQCFEERIGPNCECECPIKILQKEIKNDVNICGISNRGQRYSSAGCGCDCPVGSNKCRWNQIFNQNKCRCEPLSGFCPHPIPKENKCQSITDKVRDLNEPGILSCDRPNDCCLCQSIECGSKSIPCKTASFGIESAAGVQNIQIIGDQTSDTMLSCFGERACADSRINARQIYDILCIDNYSCHRAHIIVSNPVNGFGIDCGANGSCKGLTLDINIPSIPDVVCDATNVEDIYLGSIECGAAESCKDAVFNVNNNGCNRIIFDSIECIEGGSCLGAQFNFNGFITIKNCDLSSNEVLPLGILDGCYSNLLKLSCPESGSCSNQVRNIINPINGFQLLCKASMSCSHSSFTINIQHKIKRNRVEFMQIKCNEENACNTANFVINNQQIAVKMIIEIECIGENACFDTKFRSLSGDTLIVKCNHPLFCDGCTYNGISCDQPMIL